MYARLGSFGIEPKFVRDYILPEWWDDEATTTRAGFTELVYRVSEGLGISAQSLLDEDSSPMIASLPNCRFKGGDKINNFDAVVGICKRAAELATFSIPDSPANLAICADAEQIRESILSDGNRWVDLENLSQFCWDHGVPVLHITNFPKNVRKPDGMLISVGDRPAIIICNKHKQPAKLLFILAHELGHLIAGHVSGDDLIVDAQVNGQNESKHSDDAEEFVADSLALAILTGDRSKNYRANNKPKNARELAARCKVKGDADHVYPGHIVLNYINGLSGSFHGLGAAALNVLYPRPNGPQTLRRSLEKNIDLSALPEDHAEYLLRIAGANEPNL